jgi:hypothetical protein
MTALVLGMRLGKPASGIDLPASVRNARASVRIVRFIPMHVQPEIRYHPASGIDLPASVRNAREC